MSKVTKIVVEICTSDSILSIIDALEQVRKQYPTAELHSYEYGELTFDVNQFEPKELKDE